MTISRIDWQARAYEKMPDFLRRPLNSVRVLPTYLRWLMAQDGQRKAKQILGPLRGAFGGCRCVVIGNGPSLNRMDLSFLRDEFTFGLNRIYLKFPELGFSTTFLVSVNRFVISQFGHEMEEAPCLKILNWRYSKHLISGSSDMVGIVARPFGELDGEILEGYYLGGGTVTNVALELAHFFGFAEVLLIGVDHSYSERGTPSKPIEASEPDKDHFSKDYFGPGVVWQLPNFEAMERGYGRVRKLFYDEDRIVVDGTVDGQLDIFEKVDYEEYLSRSSSLSKKMWRMSSAKPSIIEALIKSL